MFFQGFQGKLQQLIAFFERVDGILQGKGSITFRALGQFGDLFAVMLIMGNHVGQQRQELFP